MYVRIDYHHIPPGPVHKRGQQHRQSRLSLGLLFAVCIGSNCALVFIAGGCFLVGLMAICKDEIAGPEIGAMSFRDLLGNLAIIGESGDC